MELRQKWRMFYEEIGKNKQNVHRWNSKCNDNQTYIFTNVIVYLKLCKKLIFDKQNLKSDKNSDLVQLFEDLVSIPDIK